MSSSYNFSGASGTFVGVGTGATGEYHGGPAPTAASDLPRMIAELAALVDRHAAGLDEPGLAREAMSAIRAEILTPAPRWGRVARRAADLEEAAANRPDVAAAARRLGEEASHRTPAVPAPPSEGSNYYFPQASGTFVGVGTGASGVYRSAATLPAAVADLRAALVGSRALVADPEAAERALTGIEEELRAPTPHSSGTIAHLLRIITTAAPSVTAVAGAVQAISTAIHGA